MGFSDEDQNLMENVYVLNIMEQKILLRNFLIEVGDCGDWTNFRKAARNWHDGKTKPQHW